MTSAKSDDDVKWMREAIRRANRAEAAGDVPIGAVVVRGGRVIGSGFNTRQAKGDPTGHAEIAAIRRAAKRMGDWRLVDCTLYVTLEPCPMCAGAIVNARVTRLVYGADDPKMGAVRTLYELCNDRRLNHRVDVRAGVLGEECGELLKTFFQDQRKRNKQRKRSSG
jgi:tRNA(adenine34) deaminase